MQQEPRFILSARNASYAAGPAQARGTPAVSDVKKAIVDGNSYFLDFWRSSHWRSPILTEQIEAIGSAEREETARMIQALR